MQKNAFTAFNLKADEFELFENLAKENDVIVNLFSESLTSKNAQNVETEFVSISYESKITREVLEVLQTKNVKLIKTRTIGFNNIDVQAANELGIEVQNTQYVTDGIAEHIIMLILMCMRQLNKIFDNAKENNFGLLPERSDGLHSKTVGIIGTGRIGKELIKRLNGFECEIIANDKLKTDGIKYCELDELFEKSDIIIPLTPLTSETEHLINENSISKMKKGVLIINCSRGALLKRRICLKDLIAEELDMPLWMLLKTMSLFFTMI